MNCQDRDSRSKPLAAVSMASHVAKKIPSVRHFGQRRASLEHLISGSFRPSGASSSHSVAGEPLLLQKAPKQSVELLRPLEHQEVARTLEREELQIGGQPPYVRLVVRGPERGLGVDDEQRHSDRGL